MAQTEHRALVEVLRVGAQDSDKASTTGPPVVVLKDLMKVWRLLVVVDLAYQDCSCVCHASAGLLRECRTLHEAR